jgi:hypothetical protein
MTKSIALRELIAETFAGARLKVVVRIDPPQLQPDFSWRCLASVEGLPDRPLDAHGTDSLQALLLAIKNVRGSLERFVKNGGRLYWPGDEQGGPMSVAELFSDGL